MNKKDVEIVGQPSMKRSPSKELRRCTECDFNCYGEIPFKKHCDSVHRQCTLFQCAICEFEATSLPLLNAHMQAKHTDKERDTHLCNKCEKSFPYRFLLENHICFKCNKCSFIGNSSIAIASHVQANHEKVSVQIETNIRFQCELCDYTYKYNIQIKKHRQAAHNSTDTNEEFPCEECNLSFGNSKYLEEHMQSYHHNTAVPCSYCGIPLDKKDYREHMLEFHEDTVILYTIGKQVDELHEKLETIEAFKSDLIHNMKNLMNAQNEIKQELFLIRNNQINKNYSSPEPKKETSKISAAVKETNSDKVKTTRSYAKVASKKIDVKDDGKKEKDKKIDTKRDGKTVDRTNYENRRHHSKTQRPYYQSHYHSNNEKYPRNYHRNINYRHKEHLSIPRNSYFIGQEQSQRFKQSRSFYEPRQYGQSYYGHRRYFHDDRIDYRGRNFSPVRSYNYDQHYSPRDIDIRSRRHGYHQPSHRGRYNVEVSNRFDLLGN